MFSGNPTALFSDNATQATPLFFRNSRADEIVETLQTGSLNKAPLELLIAPSVIDADPFSGTIKA